MQEHLCPQCGRPVSIHKHDHVGDYHAAYTTCTATEALEAAQARFAESAQGKAERKAAADGKPDHARARRWFTYTDTEGTPTFDWPLGGDDND